MRRRNRPDPRSRIVAPYRDEYIQDMLNELNDRGQITIGANPSSSKKYIPLPPPPPVPDEPINYQGSRKIPQWNGKELTVPGYGSSESNTDNGPRFLSSSDSYSSYSNPDNSVANEYKNSLAEWRKFHAKRINEISMEHMLNLSESENSSSVPFVRDSFESEEPEYLINSESEELHEPIKGLTPKGEWRTIERWNSDIGDYVFEPSSGWTDESDMGRQ